MVDLSELSQAIGDLREQDVKQLLDRFLAEQPDEKGLDKAIQACQEGMEEVGKRFESGEYFLAELIFAAEVLQAVMEKLRPLIKGGGPKLGKVLLCTVQGDLHDIGKNIVRDMLDAAGFEVRDLGVDVPVDQVVEEVRQFQPDVLGLSGLLTLALDSMKVTVEALGRAGLREQVKVIIGGNPVSEAVRARVGADAFTRSAAEGVEICKGWVVHQ